MWTLQKSGARNKDKNYCKDSSYVIIVLLYIVCGFTLKGYDIS